MTSLSRDDLLRLDLALAAGRLGTWRWDMTSGTVVWDERLEEIFGFPPGGFDGAYETYVGCLHPEEREGIQATVRAAVAERRGYDIEHRIVRPDGAVRWIQGRGDVTLDDDGAVTGTIGCVADVTDRKAEEARREEEAARDTFLAEASTVLAESLDLEATLAHVADLAVPRLADACAVYLVDDDGTPRPVGFRHRDPERERVIGELHARYPLRPGTTGSGLALASGRTQVIPEVAPWVLEEIAVDEDHLALLHQARVGAGVAVPLVARGRVVGLLGLVVDPGRPFGDEEVALAEEVGRRAATAIDNARLFTIAQSIADALQAGLAPAALPAVPGLLLAARYRAAGEGVEVGGDFYDVIPLGDEDAWLLVIGDVCGRGSGAAALNAQVRFATRALARTGLDAAGVAAALNENVVADAAVDQFCTLDLAVLRPGTPTVVELVSAGHPQPVVVRVDGSIDDVAAAGPLLGVVAGAAYDPMTVTLAPGDALVLLTDGVLEARRNGDQFGYERLHDVLRTVAGRPADAVAAAVEAAVVEHTGGPLSDDVAVVVVQTSP